MEKKHKKTYTRIRDTDKRNEIMKWVVNHTWKEISAHFNVSESTLRRWHKEYKKSSQKTCKPWRPARLPRWEVYYKQCCTIKYILKIEKPNRFPINKILPLMPPNTHRSTVHRLVKDTKLRLNFFWHYKRDRLPLEPLNKVEN